MDEYTTEELNKMYDEAMEGFLTMEKRFEETGFFTAEDEELANCNQTNIE